MHGITGALSRGRLLSFSKESKEALRAEFEQTALPHLSHLYTTAYYLIKEQAEAEDLVQETYLRAFRFFHKFRPGTNCRAWLLSILRNLFINRYRENKRKRDTVDWEKIDQAYDSIVAQHGGVIRDNPESLFFSQLMDHEIEQALKELPEEYRTAIILVSIQELSYEEAAKVMECPVGTVRSRVSRGRRMLQLALKEYALKRGMIKE